MVAILVALFIICFLQVEFEIIKRFLAGHIKNECTKYCLV